MSVPPPAEILLNIDYKDALFFFVILNKGDRRVADDSKLINENLSFSPSKSIM